MFSIRYERFLRPLCYDARMTRACAVVLAMLLGTTALVATREDLARPGSSSTTASSTRPSPPPPPHARHQTPPTPPRSCSPARTSSGIASSPIRPTSAQRATALGAVRRRAARDARPRGVPDRAGRIAVPRGRLRRGGRDLRVGDGDRTRGRRGRPESVLDWYGSAMERWAAPYVTSRRAQMLARLVARMEGEQAKNPGSRAASYWLAAGLRAQGELDRAWQAAIAAWVRAPHRRRQCAGPARRHRPPGARRHHSRPRQRSSRWRT